MNDARRKQIAAIRERLARVFEDILEPIRQDFQDVIGDEQEAFDNMPESLQAGERGDKAREAISALEAAMEAIESLDFEAIFSSLEEATA